MATKPIHSAANEVSAAGSGPAVPTALAVSTAMAAPAALATPAAPAPGAAGKKRPRPSGLPTRALPYPEAVERVITELARLPGIGPRAAERVALHVLRSAPEEASALAASLVAMRQEIGHCSRCFNLAGRPAAVEPGAQLAPMLCAVCAEPSRDDQQILIVEQPRDVLALEQLRMFNGLYHVLLGRLSPLDGIGPESLTLGYLIDRIASAASAGRPVSEVILGLSPTLEGDATMLYISEALATLGVSVSRLSRGLPAGQALEFANKTALADALEGRRKV